MDLKKSSSIKAWCYANSDRAKIFDTQVSRSLEGKHKCSKSEAIDLLKKVASHESPNKKPSKKHNSNYQSSDMGIINLNDKQDADFITIDRMTKDNIFATTKTICATSRGKEKKIGMMTNLLNKVYQEVNTARIAKSNDKILQKVLLSPKGFSKGQTSRDTCNIKSPKSSLRLKQNINKSQKVISNSKDNSVTCRPGSSGINLKNFPNSPQHIKPDAQHFYSSSMFSSPKMYIHSTNSSTPITKNFNTNIKQRHPSMAVKNISKLKSRPNTSHNSNTNYTASQTYVSESHKVASSSNPKKISSNRHTSSKSPQEALGFNSTKNSIKTNIGIKTSLLHKKDKSIMQSSKEIKREKEDTGYKGRFFLGDKIIDKHGVKTLKTGTSNKGSIHTQRNSTLANSKDQQILNLTGTFKNYNSGKLYNNTKSRLAKKN